MTQSHKLPAIAIRVEVSNRKKELQRICEAMVEFKGWTSAPRTFAESEKRLEDLQSFMPLESSAVLEGTTCNAWYDTWTIFSGRTVIGMLSIGRESRNNPLTSAMQRNSFCLQNTSVAMGWRTESISPSVYVLSKIDGSRQLGFLKRLS